MPYRGAAARIFSVSSAAGAEVASVPGSTARPASKKGPSRPPGVTVISNRPTPALSLRKRWGTPAGRLT